MSRSAQTRWGHFKKDRPGSILPCKLLATGDSAQLEEDAHFLLGTLCRSALLPPSLNPHLSLSLSGPGFTPSLCSSPICHFCSSHAFSEDSLLTNHPEPFASKGILPLPHPTNISYSTCPNLSPSFAWLPPPTIVKHNPLPAFLSSVNESNSYPGTNPESGFGLNRFSFSPHPLWCVCHTAW